jgi:hypothetical protein
MREPDDFSSSYSGSPMNECGTIKLLDCGCFGNDVPGEVTFQIESSHL